MVVVVICWVGVIIITMMAVEIIGECAIEVEAGQRNSPNEITAEETAKMAVVEDERGEVRRAGLGGIDHGRGRDREDRILALDPMIIITFVVGGGGAEEMGTMTAVIVGVKGGAEVEAEARATDSCRLLTIIIMRTAENFWMGRKAVGVAAGERMSGTAIVIAVGVVIVIDTGNAAGVVIEIQFPDAAGVEVWIEGRKRNTIATAAVGTVEIQMKSLARHLPMETEVRLQNVAEVRVGDPIAGIEIRYLDLAESVHRGRSIGEMLVPNGAARRKKANEERIGNRRRMIEASKGCPTI